MREAVVWLGLPDPCETRQTLLESADDTGDAIRTLLDALARYDIGGQGFLVGELIEQLYPANGAAQGFDAMSVSLRSAIENFLSLPAGRAPNPRKLANRLKGIRRKVVDGRYLDIDPSAGRREGVLWKVLTIEQNEVSETEAGEVVDDIPV